MGSSDSRKKGRCAGGAYGSGLSGCPEFIADHEFRSACMQLNRSIASGNTYVKQIRSCSKIT